ncbi:hypothetical protein [Stenotrophomonas maltophilia]|uniref:hypothetical protein n=1 Tax=Stenotrophomonas maltophilia TaxID=40324 RepID=UPI00066AAF9C|nr:hypothetical protein [Stenotrophomonas maltophilia]ELK2666309.1 hypothetical protein [Stenotrophomonas maltophilia]MBH1376372.1 hypothetical protein [Stenotrophomonas maltophilia]MBH1440557.1 hypothetical protein [Stenotrophomonas maltophilia]MBH1558187.1 hypothetical protein [Stenotrophomonas maltophilia]MBH1677453.1 hypothetical protein [Stenotrophomonas maltophilia]
MKKWDLDGGGVAFSDAVNYLEAMGQRLFSEDLDETALVLRGLYEDRTFLVNYLAAQLRSELDVGNEYSSQVFVLKKSKFFTLRAVLWEPPRGVAGEEMFLYEMPHDHDFSFFTLGYFGPGYETEVRSYDQGSVVGLVGENVYPLQGERFTLKERRVVLYEGGRDIHNQYPPEALSISFNVIQDISAFGIKRRQYEFDEEFSEIKRVLNVNPIPLFVRAACAVGGEAVNYVEEVARFAPTEYARAAALKALVDLDARYVDLALRDSSSYVRREVLESPSSPNGPLF